MPLVAVLMGGASAEREISLQTGAGVHKALDSLGFQTITLDFDPRFIEEMRAHAARSLDLLEERLSTLNEPSRAHAEAVLANRRALIARFDKPGDLRTPDFDNGKLRGNKKTV